MTHPIKLHLFPGVTGISKYGMSHIDVTYYSDSEFMITQQYSTGYDDMYIYLDGNRWCYGIKVKALMLGKAETTVLEYSMRFDDLILLNIASKLLKK